MAKQVNVNIVRREFKVGGRRRVFSVTKLRDAYDEAVYFQTEIMVEFEIVDKL